MSRPFYIHYSSAHKGAAYKDVHIYGIIQQRSNRSSDHNDNRGANAHVQ